MCALIQCVTVTRASQRGQLGYEPTGGTAARANKPTITSACVMVGTLISLWRLHSLHLCSWGTESSPSPPAGCCIPQKPGLCTGL
jgi:hypothetical protein